MRPRGANLRRCAGLALLLLAATSHIAIAQESSGRTSARASDGPRASARHKTTDASSGDAPSRSTSSLSGLWTTVVAVSAVVGSLGAVAFWVRPLVGGVRGIPNEALELLGRKLLEPKIAVHLIRCGRRVLVVSVSPEGARSLAEITDPAEVQHLVDTCRAPRESRILSVLGGESPAGRAARTQAEARRAG